MRCLSSQTRQEASSERDLKALCHAGWPSPAARLPTVSFLPVTVVCFMLVIYRLMRDRDASHVPGWIIPVRGQITDEEIRPTAVAGRSWPADPLDLNRLSL